LNGIQIGAADRIGIDVAELPRPVARRRPLGRRIQRIGRRLEQHGRFVLPLSQRADQPVELRSFRILGREAQSEDAQRSGIAGLRRDRARIELVELGACILWLVGRGEQPGALHARQHRRAIVACRQRGLLAAAIGHLGARGGAGLQPHVAQRSGGGEDVGIVGRQVVAQRAHLVGHRLAVIPLIAFVQRDSGVCLVDRGDRLGVARRLVLVARHRAGEHRFGGKVIAGAKARLGQRDARLRVAHGRAAASLADRMRLLQPLAGNHDVVGGSLSKQ
jgi:hypothetical protein